jgi:hypothetical protein
MRSLSNGAENLLQLLLQDRREVFRDLECLHRDANGGNTLGRLSIDSVFGNAFLDSDVIRVLGEEVGHGCGVLGRELLHQFLVLVVRHVITEHLLTTGIRNRGVRVGATASISGHRNLLARLGLDGEFDLVKISIFLSTWPGKGLHGGEVLVGSHRLDIVNGYIVEGNQEGKLVDRHIFQHAFCISLETLAERLGSVLVGIVGDEGNVRSGDGLGKFAGLANILANVLIVAHEDLDASLFGLLGHLLKLGNSGSTRFLEVDALGSMSDGLSQETRIIGRAARDEGQARGGGWRKIVEAGCELDTVLGLRLGLPFLELWTARPLSAGAHEPGLDDEIERSVGAPANWYEEKDPIASSNAYIGKARLVLEIRTKKST